MTIIDRRKGNKNKSGANRKRFLDRCKRNLRKAVANIANKRNIKDIVNDGEVTVDADDLEEYSFNHDPRTGKKDIVLPGNTTHSKGDKLPKPQSGDGQGGGGSSDGDGIDEFSFALSKEEFLDIYFHDMQLPNFIKENLKDAIKFVRQRAGYTKEGIPARLNIKKTFEMAMARKIATKSQGKKPRYLDDIDIRYNYFTRRPKPVRKAVMFCLMDVSISMGEFEKTLSKKFFLLLYLFLHKEYELVDIIFIRHTQDANEVDEQTFFYSEETGGTIVSSALKLTAEIMEERYDSSEVNFYVAQSSDGDNWEGDSDVCADILENTILPKVQYYAYIQTEDFQRIMLKKQWKIPDLYNRYKEIQERHKNFAVKRLNKSADVYPVLRDLFEKGE